MSNGKTSDDTPDEELGHKAARGAAVTLAGQGLRIALQIISVVVLARLVSPDDYGLTAIVLVIVGIGEIFRDFGLSNAAIQAPGLTVQQRDNLFWINTAIGLVLSLVIFAMGGLVSTIFEQAELTLMVQVVAVTFLMNGMATQYRASLNRDLRFKSLIVCEVVAQAVGLIVGVVAGLAGAGYWALIGQQIVQSLAGLVLVAVAGRWLPGRPRRGFGMLPFLRFGSNLVGTQLINYASNNIDSVIIGLRFTPAELGFYNRAFQLLMTPLNQLRAPMTTVALPVFSRLQTDFERSGRYMKLGQTTLGYTVVAGLSVAVGAAESFVQIFLGSTWISVTSLFAFIAIAGVLQTLPFVGYWIYMSRGLTGPLFRYTLISASIKVCCIVAGSQWGVLGVAIGYAIAPALSWPISLWWLSRYTPIPLRDLRLGALRFLGLAILAAGAAHGVQALLSGLPAALTLIGASLGALAVYGIGMLLIPTVRVDIRSVVAIGRRVGKRS